MRTTMMIALAVAVLGCGGKKSESGGGGGGKAKDADPAAANAAVPAELKGKLEFDTAKDDQDHVAWVKPKGWKEGAIPGMVKPPDDANLGFMTKYAVGTNCDGTCTSKDWPAVADKVEFAPLASAGTVERDETTPGGRTMVVASGDRKDLAMVWWKKGAEHYVVCRASLEKEVVPALAAFEAACKATVTGL
ncbi:MAG: hypothetical protein JNK64_04730 [Myxococcales bacterium]|nr:hypothetical protein [Myxococcales bacterium]